MVVTTDKGMFKTKCTSVHFVEPILKICITFSLTAPLCGSSGIDSQSGGLMLVGKIYLCL